MPTMTDGRRGETETHEDWWARLGREHADSALEHLYRVESLLKLTLESHLNRLGSALGDDLATKLIAYRLVKLNDARVTFSFLHYSYARSTTPESDREFSQEVNREVWDALEEIGRAQQDVDEYLTATGGGLRWKDADRAFPRLDDWRASR